MKQALHILRKDIRQFRSEIALTWIVAAVYVFVESRPPASPRFWGSSSSVLFLLPLSAWLLISRVIHAEPLPDSRQFWLTRPYSRRGLLLEKSLFIFLFVVVPYLVADLTIVLIHGFRLESVVGALLCRYALFGGSFFLPVAAMAAVTSGMVEMLVIAIAVWVIAVFPGYFSDAGLGTSFWTLEWLQTALTCAVLGIGAITCLWWQYARRRTNANRALLALAWLVTQFGLGAVPWTAKYRIQMAVSHRGSTPPVRVELDTRPWFGSSSSMPGGRTRVVLPVKISGRPLKDLVFDAAALEIRSPAGVWHSTRIRDTRVIAEPGVITLETVIPERLYSEIRRVPATFRGGLYLTVKGAPEEVEVPLIGGPVQGPHGGVCSLDGELGADGRATYLAKCSYAFRQPPGWVSFSVSRWGGAYQSFASYSPLPADLDPVPVRTAFDSTGPLKQRLVSVRAALTPAVAHIRQDFELPGVVLDSYNPLAPVPLAPGQPVE